MFNIQPCLHPLCCYLAWRPSLLLSFVSVYISAGHLHQVFHPSQEYAGFLDMDLLDVASKVTAHGVLH